MGILLFAGSLGSIFSLPLGGRLVGRFGSRQVVRTSVALITISLGAGVYAVTLDHPYLVGIGLFLAMAGVGAMDVAMNFAGTVVEQSLGRSIMPHFHGGFSLGTIAGAGLGTLASRAGVPITTHVWLAVTIVAIASFVASSFFLPDPAAPTEADPAATKPRGAWREGRTLLIGVIVMSVSLTEGAANDWLALGIREGFDVPEHQGAFGLTLFVTAMTVMRFAGTALLNKFGRVAILRFSAVFGIIGLLIFGFAPTLPLALTGTILWGLGAALGFPVGMSAASDDPLRAAARLSVVSTIGYGAFLIGPPLLGLIADVVGYRHALVALLVPLVLGLAVMHHAVPRGSQVK